MAIKQKHFDSAFGEVKELINTRADALDRRGLIHENLIRHDECANEMMGTRQKL